MDETILQGILLESLPEASDEEQQTFTRAIKASLASFNVSGLVVVESEFAFNLAELLAEGMASGDIAFKSPQ